MGKSFITRLSQGIGKGMQEGGSPLFTENFYFFIFKSKLIPVDQCKSKGSDHENR